MNIFVYHYKNTTIKRYDDSHLIKYFDYTDFPSLNRSPIEFKTKQGNKIQGYFYSYPNYKEDHLVIFCHGIGGGHRSYMREIEFLCKNGYRVLSYDNIGCFESEGKNIRAMSESINDLHCVLLTLKEKNLLDGIKVSLIGHSWGGHAVSNILSYYKDIYSITCISGYSSHKLFINYCLKNKYAFIGKAIQKYEDKQNKDYSRAYSYDAVKDTKTKVLFIHSKDDPVVPLCTSAFEYKDRINNPNVRFLLVDNKKHNPNYTIDAVNYMNECFGTYNKLCKEKKLKSFKEKKEYMNQFEWYRMTEQDPEVWSEIFKELK